MSQTFVLLGLFILFKSLDWAGWMCVFWLICPVCRRCVRWWPSIFMATVFFHLISSLPSVPPPPYTVIITATKETAFPLCSGKVPLAMLKCFSFLCLLSLGKWWGGNLIENQGKKGIITKKRKRQPSTRDSNHQWSLLSFQCAVNNSSKETKGKQICK